MDELLKMPAVGERIAAANLEGIHLLEQINTLYAAKNWQRFPYLNKAKVPHSFTTNSKFSSRISLPYLRAVYS